MRPTHRIPSHGPQLMWAPPTLGGGMVPTHRIPSREPQLMWAPPTQVEV